MKTRLRAASLGLALTLAGFAASSAATISTCTYWCQNATTGQRAIVQTGAAQADCCSGNVTCPPGSTYLGTLSWTGASGPLRCRF